MSGKKHRHGLFEAAPERFRLRLDNITSASQLSREIIRSAWGWALAGSVLMALGGLATTLIPAWLGRTVDTVVAPAVAGAEASGVWRELVIALACLGGMYLVIITAQRLGHRFSWYGIQRAEHELSQQLLELTLRRAGRDHVPGERVSRLTADVRRSCQVLHALVGPPGELLQLLVTTALLWSFHPWLGLTLIIGAPLMLVGMYLVALPLGARVEDELEALGETAGTASDTLGGYRTLRGLHAERVAADRYATASRRALTAAVKSRSAEAWFEGLAELTGGLFAAALVGLAALLAVAGQISVGQLAAVTGLSTTVLGSLIGFIANLTGLWAATQGAGRRILDLMTSEPTDRTAPGPPPTGVVRNGFTTVRVPADAVHATAEALAAGWPGTLLAPHPEQLLAGSVLDNVRATGENPASPERATEALRRVGLEATELANGYATDTGDNGSALSGGQRQRVALARAVAADPEVLILVNPTSSVDTVTEHHIAQELHRVRAGRTTVVISDSPAFRAVADRVVEVES